MLREQPVSRESAYRLLMESWCESGGQQMGEWRTVEKLPDWLWLSLAEFRKHSWLMSADLKHILVEVFSFHWRCDLGWPAADNYVHNPLFHSCPTQYTAKGLSQNNKF